MKGIAWLLLLAVPVSGWAYPIDGADYTGIQRLEGVRLAQQGQARARILPPGGRWPMAQVVPQLTGDHPASRWQQPPPSDPELTAQLQTLLGDRADRIGLAVLDLSDPQAIRSAELNGQQTFNPGSVGKLVVALALFQALADIYPDDIPRREQTLRAAQVTADGLIRVDSHDVPFWSAEERRMHYRPLREGDRASLWTYLDWMLSASSNAAASMVIRELLLLRHFGARYPVAAEEAEAFFRTTPKPELSELLLSSLQQPIERNGFDPQQLRQGGFFTREGKRFIAGTTSHCTARELLRYLLLLEQGRLVDLWSSREIKRLLYMTGRRIRYASAPALKDAAVCFKSGSLYRCRPEPGFVCRKYQGNVDNMLNSVAIIEQEQGEGERGGRRLHYLVVLLSNVLKENSAVAHQTLALRIHRLIEGAHPLPAAESGRSDHPAGQ